MIFDPNMSYTVQANISIERFLQSEKLNQIHQDFVNASQQADRYMISCEIVGKQDFNRKTRH